MVAHNSYFISEEDATKLFKILNKHSVAQKLTDLQLADAATSIWGNLVGGSDEEIILNELIERFERMTGIKRDEETGEAIP